VCIPRPLLIRQNIDEILPEKFTEFFLKYNILFGFVGKNQFAVSNFIILFQIFKNGNEWGNSCSTGNKNPFSFIVDIAKWFMNNQFISFTKRKKLIGNSIAERISFNGKFKMIIFR
jgi:hypothetical protein